MRDGPLQTSVETPHADHGLPMWTAADRSIENTVAGGPPKACHSTECAED